MKKLLSFLLVIVMICLSTSAVWGAERKPAKITLQSAIDTALKNDGSLKLLDDKIKLAERRYNMAVAAAKLAPDKTWSSDTQRINNKLEELLYPLQKEADLNEFLWQKSNSEKKLRIDVTLLYFQILQSQRYIDNQNNIVSRTKAEYESIQKKVKSGIVTETMALSYEIAVKNAETVLKGYERDLGNLKSSLNQKMGNALDAEILLTETKLPNEIVDIDSIEDLAVQTVTESHDVKKLENNKLLTKTRYDVLYRYSYIRPDECDTLEDSLLNSDYDIRDKKVAVELKIRQDYNNILNLKDDITIKQMDYDQKVKLAEISKKKYDLGMSTYLDYLSAQNDVGTAEVDLNNAQLEYYKAVQSFRMYIDPVELKTKQ